MDADLGHDNNSSSTETKGEETHMTHENPEKIAKAGYLGFSPAFVTDVVRMESLKEMHQGDFEVMSISEHPEVAGHICTDFSSSRGWKTILEGFFDLLCLDYSWIQRDYFYTNYGGKRWFFDPSVPNNKGFVQRFFEWNGKVIILPLDERGDVWHEFCTYQSKNNFDYQLLQHESCPLVQATRRAEYTKQWAAVPSEFKCKTDRNQRRYLRYPSAALESQDDSQLASNLDQEEMENKKALEKHKLVARATHIAFVNRNGGQECLSKYINHRKAEFRRMSKKYPNPTGITVKAHMNNPGAAATLPTLVVTSVQWVQCDKCSKWRSIPDSVLVESLPEQWECSMNEWDATHNHCGADEVSEEAMRYPGVAIQPGQGQGQGQAQGHQLPGGSHPVNAGALGAIEEKEGEATTDHLVIKKEVEGVSAGDGVVDKGVAEGKEGNKDEDAGEEGEVGLWNDLLTSLPRNFPPAVVDETRLSGGWMRTTTPRPKRPRGSLSRAPGAAPASHSSSSSSSSSASKRKVKKRNKAEHGEHRPETELGVSAPVVQVSMHALPSAGVMLVESWVQCETRHCQKWHLVDERAMTFMKDKKVTCGLLGLECPKAAPNKLRTEEKQQLQHSDKFAACSFDPSFMQCTACNRLSYKRDVMKGKHCDCGY